jgi:hypothetical protein
MRSFVRSSLETEAAADVRILVATDQWFPNDAGGAARFATEQAVHLAAAGHDVHVLAPRGIHLPPPLRSAGAIPRLRLPNTLVDPIATLAAARAHRGTAFDVVIAHQVTTAYGCLRALPRTPLVLVFHASAAREARLRAAGSGAPGKAKAAVLARLLTQLERTAVGSPKTTPPLGARSSS